MGTPTGKIVTRICSTGYGSNHYGLCQVCGDEVLETFYWSIKQEYQNADGSLSYSTVGEGKFGHRECLQANDARWLAIFKG